MQYKGEPHLAVLGEDLLEGDGARGARVGDVRDERLKVAKEFLIELELLDESIVEGRVREECH